MKPLDISLMVGSFGSFFVISCLTNETLSYEACQDLLKWVSSGTLVPITNKTNQQDITETIESISFLRFSIKNQFFLSFLHLFMYFNITS